jgi:hypothetical protein
MGQIVLSDEVDLYDVVGRGTSGNSMRTQGNKRINGQMSTKSRRTRIFNENLQMKTYQWMNI